MQVFQKSRPQQWPLWIQLTLALGSTVVIVSFIAGNLSRRLETNYLLGNLERQSQQTLDLLSAVSIDAVITEDRPLLETFVDQAVSHDPDIATLRIDNEDGTMLAVRQQEAPLPEASSISFSQAIMFGGDTFGTMHITWNIEHSQQEIEQRVQRTQLFTIGILLLMALMIILWGHWLTVRPINKINQHLIMLTGNHPKPKLHISAAQELMRLGDSVNTLDEALQLRNQREADLQAARTQLIQINAELRQAKELAEQAARVKTAFLASMSHE
ncbi:MAG: hypothetical protein GY761_19560, partial [Hyphomicrobiales bacterium]|nr:hypothetical protein [Hyphomicrobiales bacterium]